MPSALVAARRSIVTAGGTKPPSAAGTRSGRAVTSPVAVSTRKLWVGLVTEDSPTKHSRRVGLPVQPDQRAAADRDDPQVAAGPVEPPDLREASAR